MRFSGEQWELEPPVYQSIEVIEPQPRKRSKKDRKKRRKAKKVPFGFARALPKGRAR
jgi:hypothetical protein